MCQIKIRKFDFGPKSLTTAFSFQMCFNIFNHRQKRGLRLFLFGPLQNLLSKRPSRGSDL